MRASLLKFWEDAWASYWFLPLLMALGAAVLAVLLTSVEEGWGLAWLVKNDWLRLGGAEGARTLLSTIAGSMITVAGVTFSIAIAAVAYTASVYGPRLLTGFMQDRGNQLTLGTFVATFVYGLLVLHTIRGPETPGGAFVPRLAVLVGVGLALCSMGVLIYFIHHVPDSIRIANVIAGIGRDLNAQIEHRFPKEAPAAASEAPHDDVEALLPADFREAAAPVRLEDDGYLQHVDEEGLLKVAAQHDLVIRLEYRPGDFAAADKVLAHARPMERVDEAVEKQIREVCAWGRQRTPRQDPLFLIDELVEIAARAVSPAINEPLTAITCLDRLGGALTRMAGRSLPAPQRRDADGVVRLVVPALTFEDFASVVFAQVRPYVEADRNTALHAMKVLGDLACAFDDPSRRRVLQEQADALKGGSMQALGDEQDRAAVKERYCVVSQLLRREGAVHEVRSGEEAWLGGSG